MTGITGNFPPEKQLPVNEYSLISKHHLPVFYPMIGNDPTGKHKEIPGMKGDPKTARAVVFHHPADLF